MFALTEAEVAELVETGAADSDGAVLRESSVIAPGHGGRDHMLEQSFPERGISVLVSYRTHEQDHSASLMDRLEAWRSRRWARAVQASITWEDAPLSSSSSTR